MSGQSGRAQTNAVTWELIELLNELRVALGRQVLFAFLLAIRLQTGFPATTRRDVYFIALIATMVSTALLSRPAHTTGSSSANTTRKAARDVEPPDDRRARCFGDRVTCALFVITDFLFN